MRKLLTFLIALAVTVGVSASAFAQVGIGVPTFVTPAASWPPSYTGPGDVYGTAFAWWGLRAFSAADRGNRLINICDPTKTTCADWSSSPTTGLLVGQAQKQSANI